MNQNGKINFHNYHQQQNINPNQVPINNQYITNKPNLNINQNFNPNQYNQNQKIETNIPNNNNNIINQNLYKNNNNNINSLPNPNNRMPNINMAPNNLNYPQNNNINTNINNNIINGTKIPQIPLTGNKNFINIPENNHIFTPNNMQHNYNIGMNNNNTMNNNNKMTKSKEIKLKKQEEYKRMLDEQMKQDKERKDRERNYRINNGQVNLNNNINNLNNNEINGSNTNNINLDLQNLTITKPSLNSEEKERLRKKQMEYYQILNQQVEERNKKKLLEKQKEKEEEMKLEEKLKQQLIENQKRNEMLKNRENKYINNLESPENFMANPMSTMPIPQLNFQAQNNQINTFHPNYTTVPQFYGNNDNTNIINNPNIINNYENSLNATNKPSIIGGNTGLISNQNNNANNYPNNYFNITPSSNSNTNNLIRTQKTDLKYSQKPTPSQTMSAFSNSSKNNNFNNNNNPYPDGRFSHTRPSSQQQLRVRPSNWRIEELYMNFVQEQLKILNEYEININKYKNLNKDNFDTIKDLMTIKNKAIEKIQNEQNNFKNNVGVYPMDNNFNNRVTNLMDMMLEKKINEIQRENKLESLANNFNRQRNSLRNIDNNSNNGGNNNYSKSKNIQINNNKNNNNYNEITESQINRNIIDCGYKSKYEELKQSMINGNEASQELRTSMSLAGFSKFVTQNKLAEQNLNINNSNNGSNISNYNNIYCNINNGQSNLYTTWNEDKFEEEQNEINNNSNNNINDNSLNNINSNKNSNINNNKENTPIIKNKRKNNPEINHFNKKLNINRNASKGILNDSQLPSKIVGNDKGYFNHGNDDMSGSNISMQDSNSNINNYINGSDLNIEQPSTIKKNSPIPKFYQQNSEVNNLMMNNDISPIGKVPVTKLNKNLQKKVKNLKISKEEKDKSLLLVGDNIIKNNLNHIEYTQREKENKEKSYLIGNLTTANNNDTLINNTNYNNSGNNTFIHMNTNTNNNINKNNKNNNLTGAIDDGLGENLTNNNYCKESHDNENDGDNDNISIGVTLGSKRNGIENNETEEDIVRGFGQSGMNSMINDENTSNFNHSNANNNSGLSGLSGMVNHNFGKKKGMVNTNKEIQQIKEAEEKEEEENYACDFTLDNKTLKKLEEEEEKSQNLQKINLEDYKEIKESQKIQTQLNFFEDSVMENINVGKSKGKIIKSYNMYGNKNSNLNNNQSNNGNNINNSNSKKSNNTQNTNNTNSKRPQSPKYNRNKNTNNINDENVKKSNKIITNTNNENSLYTSNNNLVNDSYGDNIINDLDKYRKMFLEESSVSSVNK